MNDSLPPEESESPPNSAEAAGGIDDPIAAFLSDIWEESKDPVPQENPVPTESSSSLGESADVEPAGTGASGQDDSTGQPNLNSVDSNDPVASGSVPLDSVAISSLPGSVGGPGSVPNQPGLPPLPPWSFPPRFDEDFVDDSSTSTRRRMMLGVAGALLAVAAVTLVWVGVKVIFDSSDGKLVTRIDDRAAPGFEAVVEKTPTALVLMVGDDGVLTSATVVALASDTTGGVLSIPVATDVYVSTGGGFVAPVALRDLVSSSGTEPASAVLGELLNLGFSDVIVLRPNDLADRVPTTLTVNNPSAVTDANGGTLFAKGSITLNASELWSFLSASSDVAGTVTSAARQEAFWKAWLASVRSAPKSSSGLDVYLAALANDQVTYQTLPVTEASPGDGQPTRLRLSPGVSGSQAVASIVPLPEGSPGRRPKLRVVDGTGQLDAAQGAAVVLAAGGGQVDIIGNSRLFGFKKTQIVYYEDSQKSAAEKMRDVLGVGEIIQSTQTNSALDLNITIGEDYLERFSTQSAGGSGD